MSYVLKCDACDYVGQADGKGGKRRFYEVAQMPNEPAQTGPSWPQVPCHVCIECLGPNAAVAAERASMETEARVAEAQKERARFLAVNTEQEQR